jgi:hypothetical protein
MHDSTWFGHETVGPRRNQKRPWFQSWLSWGWVLAMACTFSSAPVGAEEPRSTKESRADCRFEGIGAESTKPAGSTPLEAFPENDVFRPLLADPNQPQFFGAWQATRVRTSNTSVNIGSIGFGEDFGIVGRRDGCNGWQIGILGGVFAQFNLDARSIDLLNADYVIGFPLSWRYGLFSTRLRVYHQSSHLGDEFLLGNPGFPRVNLSYEAVEAIVSLDAPGGWGRIYAGGSTLFHRAPDNLDSNGVQWGAELRGPALQPPDCGSPRCSEPTLRPSRNCIGSSMPMCSAGSNGQGPAAIGASDCC